jgi:hypothetical protein
MAIPRFDEFILEKPNVNPRIDMGNPQMGGVRKLHRLNTPKTSEVIASIAMLGFSETGVLLLSEFGFGRCK